MDILLTNDDGYDSPGIHALAAHLSQVANVTIVAPREDQSAIGRVFTGTFEVTERDGGFAVAGTPVDCVVAGIEALELDPDLVVSGCNVGANLGGHALGRSGTISAAVESTFFSVPAIAVSLHVPERLWPLEAEPSHFDLASDVTTYLVEGTESINVLGESGYLNVNVPFEPRSPLGMEITRPSSHYDMGAERNGATISIRDRTWDRFDAEEIDEPRTTDRGAIARGQISVSPLIAPHRSVDSPDLDELSERFATRFQPADLTD